MHRQGVRVLENKHIDVGQLKYINEFLNEAAKLAASSGSDFLAYLIDMARTQVAVEIDDQNQRLKRPPTD
jgi:hypothetical protein